MKLQKLGDKLKKNLIKKILDIQSLKKSLKIRIFLQIVQLKHKTVLFPSLFTLSELSKVFLSQYLNQGWSHTFLKLWPHQPWSNSLFSPQQLQQMFWSQRHQKKGIVTTLFCPGWMELPPLRAAVWWDSTMLIVKLSPLISFDNRMSCVDSCWACILLFQQKQTRLLFLYVKVLFQSL